MSTHNIYFHGEISKILIWICLLSEAMNSTIKLVFNKNLANK